MVCLNKPVEILFPISGIINQIRNLFRVACILLTFRKKCSKKTTNVAVQDITPYKVTPKS